MTPRRATSSIRHVLPPPRRDAATPPDAAAAAPSRVTRHAPHFFPVCLMKNASRAHRQYDISRMRVSCRESAPCWRSSQRCSATAADSTIWLRPLVAFAILRRCRLRLMQYALSTYRRRVALFVCSLTMAEAAAARLNRRATPRCPRQRVLPSFYSAAAVPRCRPNHAELH